MAFANDCLGAGYTSVRNVPSVLVDQLTTGSVDLQLKDGVSGQPIDLTQYGIQNTSSSSSSGAFTGVKILMKELPEDQTAWNETTADVINAAQGWIKIEYDATFTRRAGVFTAEAQVWQDGTRRRIFPFFFIVNPSLSADNSQDGLALSIAEIRMTMRDIDPEGNVLLDALDFSQEEIALSIRRCIDYWNESLPPVTTYKPTNFPWRYHLSRGVVAVLSHMAVLQKKRNDLPYNAGGTQIRADTFWERYQDTYQQLWQEWTQWVKNKKYQINLEGAYFVLGSGYSRWEFYR